MVQGAIENIFVYNHCSLSVACYLLAAAHGTILEGLCRLVLPLSPVEGAQVPQYCGHCGRVHLEHVTLCRDFNSDFKTF